MDLEKDNPESIFWALPNILTIYFDLCENLKKNGFDNAAKAIKTGIIKRCLKYEKYHFLFNLLTGAFLNPLINFQQMLFPEEDLSNELKNLEKRFFHYLKLIVPDAFTNVQVSEVQVFRRRGQSEGYNNNQCEIDKIRNMPKGNIENILGWWEIHKNELPTLYKLAKKISSFRATSASVERIFSKGSLL